VGQLKKKSQNIKHSICAHCSCAHVTVIQWRQTSISVVQSASQTSHGDS